MVSYWAVPHCRVKSCFMLKALLHRAHEPALSIEHAACPGLALPFLILCHVQPLCPAGWRHPIPFLHPFSWDGRETGGQLPAVALSHSSFSYIFQDSSFISFVEVGEWVLEDYWWLKENPFSTIANLTCFSQIFTPIYLKPMWGKCPFRFKWKVQSPENTTLTKRHIVWGCSKRDQLYIHLLDPWESKATHIRLLN